MIYSERWSKMFSWEQACSWFFNKELQWALALCWKELLLKVKMNIYDYWNIHLVNMVDFDSSWSKQLADFFNVHYVPIINDDVRKLQFNYWNSSTVFKWWCVAGWSFMHWVATGIIIDNNGMDMRSNHFCKNDGLGICII